MNFTCLKYCRRSICINLRTIIYYTAVPEISYSLAAFFVTLSSLRHHYLRNIMLVLLFESFVLQSSNEELKLDAFYHKCVFMFNESQNLFAISLCKCITLAILMDFQNSNEALIGIQSFP